MSLDLQAKLLRVVQERTVRPVGSVAEVPVDVRILTSSNRDPEAALAAGVLRADLYYRLCVSKIVLPPLRERRDDIPLLVEHYLAVLNARYGRTVEGVRGVSAAAMEELCRRPWHGNVRELFNVLENAFTSCLSLHIGVEDLALPLSATAVGRRENGSVVQTFEGTERALIERTPASTGGNKLRAAQRLGISRKKLYAKIAKYAIPALILSHVITGTG
jgi:DNA-binding NtrC family response regulator